MSGPVPMVLAGVAAVSVALVACSSSGSSSNTTTAPTTAPTSAALTSEAATSAGTTAAAAGVPFGPGCASLGVPASALSAAAALPVSAAAAAVPVLSNVVAAAQAGGLVATLNAAPAITVFAPTNAAFAKEPAALLQGLLTNPSQRPTLVATLKYHVLGTKVAKDQLVGSHLTLSGKSLTITGSGDDFTIDGKAKIVCGGIETKNAIVYVIDTVLHPAA